MRHHGLRESAHFRVIRSLFSRHSRFISLRSHYVGSFALCLAILLLTATTHAATLSLPTSTPVTRDILQTEIELRTKKLEGINKELQATQNVLSDVQREKSSLQKEVKTLDNSISQLQLNIKADEVTTQKLSFEITSLTYDLQDIESSIEGKGASIAVLFRELQKNENENAIIQFLKHNTLAESLRDAQSLDSLRSQLILDIASLRDLRNAYIQKKGDISNKKSSVEVHQENLKNRQAITAEQKQERASLLAQTKNKESVYQRQINELKKQQQDIADEIEALDATLRTKIDPSLLPTPAQGILAMPISSPH
ncbi:MAG: hypothetical protein Q7S28_01195, partial [bacterium]|nr:hypothetical protein [bacterium]